MRGGACLRPRGTHGNPDQSRLAADGLAGFGRGRVLSKNAPWGQVSRQETLMFDELVGAHLIRDG